MKVIKYLAIFILLNLVDSVLTLQALNNGFEVMPIMKYLLELNPVAFILIKIVGSAMIAYGIYRIGERRWLSSLNISRALIVGMMLVCSINIYTIVGV